MKESEKHLRRQDIFSIMKDSVSFDKTINKNDKFSAISAYMDKINDEDNGISFAIDTENDFVEFILTYDEAKVLKDAIIYMLKNFNDEKKIPS